MGNIQVLHRLGEGGMGAVFVGFDEKLQRKVALKAIRSDRRLEAAARTRFLREARILSQLDDPRICRIYDYLESDAGDFLVLELIEGQNLRQLMQPEASADKIRCWRSAGRSPKRSPRRTPKGSSTATSSPTT